MILIHEIGHVIHYFYNDYSVTNCFNIIQQNLSITQETINKCNIFMCSLDKKIGDITKAAYNPNISDDEYEKMLKYKL